MKSCFKDKLVAFYDLFLSLEFKKVLSDAFIEVIIVFVTSALSFPRPQIIISMNAYFLTLNPLLIVSL